MVNNIDEVKLLRWLQNSYNKLPLHPYSLIVSIVFSFTLFSRVQWTLQCHFFVRKYYFFRFCFWLLMMSTRQHIIIINGFWPFLIVFFCFYANTNPLLWYHNFFFPLDYLFLSYRFLIVSKIIFIEKKNIISAVYRLPKYKVKNCSCKLILHDLDNFQQQPCRQVIFGRKKLRGQWKSVS